MSEIYFDNVNNIGKLYLDYVFYEFETEPILFTCVDEKKQLYLCLCSDIRYGQKWVVAECSITTLTNLINEEIDITSAFLKVPKVIIITMDLEGNESNYVIDINKIDRLDLPKEGTFIRTDKERAKNYLWRKNYESVCLQLRKKVGATLIADEIIMSYNVVFHKSSYTTKKRLEQYCDLINKEFCKQTGKLSIKLEQSAISKDENSIHIKKKYSKQIEQIDINNANNDFYIEAA